ncbi:hypothetical protein DXG03_006236 [Asterophora parasitica]|uniref:Uncharacterized protein n=1 Tax=Asterophora parasitica TaxID=117018 RepID=A0A9P7GDW7_9AGAR|nr:hypothetical protein DXG03_006236 [Asterophora parasitica]
MAAVVASVLFIATAFAQDTDPEFDVDPYLEFRPPFAQSLPVQILLTGVVLTLVAVLFIHLIFTAQYHWPLAPVNYVLQLSGVTTLLISLIATLQVVLSATFSESERWPYMLSYIAVNVPPLDIDLGTDEWNIAERATWLVMNASTSGLIQITHIQFLTLLYPSRLEGRLIFTMLGPLAIVAAIMQLLPIQGNSEVTNIASAVRNVCNATLSLLFTAALFIWGLLVNRKQAWRTDGGTAAFGAAALALAVVSTALNFLYVPREEEYVWLPSLMWAVILWQSFLGWWWWVGAGSGSGLNGDEGIEEKMKKEAKRESRRKEARERRKETRIRAKKVWKGVTNTFIPATTHGSNRNEHPQTPSHHSDSSSSRPPQGRHRSTSPQNHQRPQPHPNAPLGSPSGRAPTPSIFSTSTTATFTTLPRLLPTFLHRWYASLRHAHLVAARQQAVERVQRIRELERGGSVVVDPARVGWGLGSFGWRIGYEDQRREAEAAPGSREFEMYDSSAWTTRLREQGETLEKDGEEEADVDVEEVQPTWYPHYPSASHRSPPTSRSPPLPQTQTHTPPRPTPTHAARPKSVWWWGPLARWRLKDSTTY